MEGLALLKPPLPIAAALKTLRQLILKVTISGKG
jgi:hypothetical protein